MPENVVAPTGASILQVGARRLFNFRFNAAELQLFFSHQQRLRGRIKRLFSPSLNAVADRLRQARHEN